MQRMKTPAHLIEQFGPREAMEYDVVIVGAGPAGLATAASSTPNASRPRKTENSARK